MIDLTSYKYVIVKDLGPVVSETICAIVFNYFKYFSSWVTGHETSRIKFYGPNCIIVVSGSIWLCYMNSGEES